MFINAPDNSSRRRLNVLFASTRHMLPKIIHTTILLIKVVAPRPADVPADRVARAWGGGVRPVTEIFLMMIHTASHLRGP